jgi:hypothetical protein
MSKKCVSFFLFVFSLNVNAQVSNKTISNNVNNNKGTETATQSNLNSQIKQLQSYTIEELTHHRNRLLKLQEDSLMIDKLLYPNKTNVALEVKQQVPDQKTDSIKLLLNKYNQLQDSVKIKANEVNRLYTSNKEYMDFLAQLNQLYSGPLDSVIKYTTIFSVVKDKKLLSSNNLFPKRLNEIQIYFNASQLLTERYNAIKIEAAKSELRKIESSNAVESLIGYLSYYSVINNSLRKTIDSISKIDQTQKVRFDPILQNRKQKEILVKIAEFYRDNEHELGIYVYLDMIVKRLLRLKVENADADVSIYLSQL